MDASSQIRYSNGRESIEIERKCGWSVGLSSANEKMAKIDVRQMSVVAVRFETMQAQESAECLGGFSHADFGLAQFTFEVDDRSLDDFCTALPHSPQNFFQEAIASIVDGLDVHFCDLCDAIATIGRRAIAKFPTDDRASEKVDGS